MLDTVSGTFDILPCQTDTILIFVELSSKSVKQKINNKNVGKLYRILGDECYREKTDNVDEGKGNQQGWRRAGLQFSFLFNRLHILEKIKVYKNVQSSHVAPPPQFF